MLSVNTQIKKSFTFRFVLFFFLFLGEVSMQKVKVQRYISGKRPEYAQYQSSDDDSDNEDFVDRKAQRSFANRGDDRYVDTRRRDHRESDENDEDFYDKNTNAADDPRLRRMQARRDDSHSENDEDDEDDDREKRLRRHQRHVHEPEILEQSEDEENENQSHSLEDIDDAEQAQNSEMVERKRRFDLDSESGSESDLSDTEIEKRRQKLRQLNLQQRKEEEVLAKEEEKQSDSSETESSEYEEESESEEENEPRLKPLFVAKRDRATIAEKEKELLKQKQLEYEAKRLAKEKRRQTLRLVEESVKKDLEKAKVIKKNSVRGMKFVILINIFC